MADELISGATGPTRLLTASDVGRSLYCRVTATNVAGSAFANAVATGPIAAAAGAPINTVPPSIADTTPQVSETLFCTSGSWTPTLPAPTFSYQWRRSGVPVGINSFNYFLTSADIGANMSCAVTATNSAGSVQAISNSVGPVTAVVTAPFNTVAPVVTGDIGVDDEVSCTPGIWSGSTPITYSYQWNRTSALDLINTVPPLASGTVADGSVLSVDEGTWTGEEPITQTYQWYAVLTDAEGEVYYDDDGRAIGVKINGARSPTYTIGGIPVAPESTWSEVDKIGALILSNGNLTATTIGVGLPDADAVCGRGTQARSTGKRYLEIKIDQIDIDVALPLGLADDTHGLAVSVMPGYSNSKGVILFATSYAGGSFMMAQTSTAQVSLSSIVFATENIIGFVFDLDTRRAWVARNGTWLGSSGAPDVGAGLYWGTAAQAAMKPYYELNPAGADFPPKITLNTGASPFVYSLPAGCVAWETP